MKRIISLLLTFILLGAVASFSANAAGTPTVYATSGVVNAGGTVTVDIAVKNNPGIVAMRLYVKYNKDYFVLKSAKDKGIFGQSTFSKDYTANPYTLLWMNGTASENYTFNDVMVTLTFEVIKNTPAGKYDIELSYNKDDDDILNWDLKPVDFATENGSVTVKEYSASVSTASDLKGSADTTKTYYVESEKATYAYNNSTGKWEKQEDLSSNVSSAEADGSVQAAEDGTYSGVSEIDKSKDKASDKKKSEKSHNKKGNNIELILIIAGAVLIIAGAAVAAVFVTKRKGNRTNEELFVEDTNSINEASTKNEPNIESKPAEEENLDNNSKE